MGFYLKPYLGMPYLGVEGLPVGPPQVGDPGWAACTTGDGDPGWGCLYEWIEKKRNWIGLDGFWIGLYWIGWMDGGLDWIGLDFAQE